MEFYDAADGRYRSRAGAGRQNRLPSRNLAVHLTTLRNSRISPRCDVAFDMSRVRDSGGEIGARVASEGWKLPRIKRREAPRRSTARTRDEGRRNGEYSDDYDMRATPLRHTLRLGVEGFSPSLNQGGVAVGRGRNVPDSTRHGGRTSRPPPGDESGGLLQRE